MQGAVRKQFLSGPQLQTRVFRMRAMQCTEEKGAGLKIATDNGEQLRTPNTFRHLSVLTNSFTADTILFLNKGGL